MKAIRTLEAALVVVGLLIAVPLAAIAIDLAASDNGDHVVMTGSQMPTGMTGMMGSQSSAKTQPADLTILHVQKGCHTWSDGTNQSPTMRLHMQSGQTLRIVNQDVDMHRMMELAGPQMMTGQAMKLGQSQTLSFTEPGTYRLEAKTLEMAGMPAVETIGPDNDLVLTVTVV